MSPAVSNREGSKELTIQEGIANQSTWVLHLQDSMLDLMSWHAPGAGLDCLGPRPVCPSLRWSRLSDVIQLGAHAMPGVLACF